jgi:hypothetical protein
LKWLKVFILHMSSLHPRFANSGSWAIDAMLFNSCPGLLQLYHSVIECSFHICSACCPAISSLGWVSGLQLVSKEAYNSTKCNSHVSILCLFDRFLRFSLNLRSSQETTPHCPGLLEAAFCSLAGHIGLPTSGIGHG